VYHGKVWYDMQCYVRVCIVLQCYVMLCAVVYCNNVLQCYATLRMHTYLCMLYIYRCWFHSSIHMMSEECWMGTILYPFDIPRNLEWMSHPAGRLTSEGYVTSYSNDCWLQRHLFIRLCWLHTRQFGKLIESSIS